MQAFIQSFQDDNLGDTELIALWQNGNEFAFETLYKKHALQLIKITLQKVNDRAIAEEIVHDVFIHIYERKHNLPVINSLPAYLYVAIKRKLLDLYKHEQVVKKHQQYLAQQAAQPLRNTVFEYLETKELEKQLEIEITKMPTHCRNVFTMRRTHELSNKEIALQLNISENTVEQHMRKALRILRAAFYFTFFALNLFFNMP